MLSGRENVAAVCAAAVPSATFTPSCAAWCLGQNAHRPGDVEFHRGVTQEDRKKVGVHSIRRLLPSMFSKRVRERESWKMSMIPMILPCFHEINYQEA